MWHCTDLHQRLAGIAPDVRDKGNRQVGRKYTAQSRSHQAIAGLNVGVSRQVWQSKS
jgi:hypothetical protein